jgi:copper chaperone NosL
MKTTAAFIIWLCLACSAALYAADAAPVAGEKDKCPVCGMFVAPYPAWTGAIVLKDRTTLFFDGPKDLFTYYNNVAKYSSGRSRSDITSVWVKEYYTQTSIDGMKALYVIGSDVLGPMGKDLVPFMKETDAATFLKDHKGSKILRFGDINLEVLKSLE